MLHPILVIWNVQPFSLRWFEYRGISVQVDSLKPTVSKVRFRETRFTWMVPCEGTFYHSLRHARTDSRNDLKHTKDPTDRFQSSFPFVLLDFHKAIIRFSGFPLLDCWHARHLQKPLCMMQAWEKKHRASQPKSSLGAPKNGAFAALERQKCLRCGAEKNHAVPRCIEAPALSTKIPNFVGQTMDCSMPR